MTKTALITGASSGVGLAAAKQLAAQGWRILAVGRNPERCAAAETEIRSVSTNGEVQMFRADLSLLADVVRLVGEVAASTDRLDLLANNAGGMAAEKVMTDEGFEASFVANHLSGFVLTLRLLPLLKKAAAEAGNARIVNTSSDGSEMIPSLNLDDMQNLENYSNGLAYCSGKLCNVLFARALAEREGQAGIFAHAFHPGTVDSNFFSHTDQSVQDAYRDVEKLSLDQGAETLVWLATSDEALQSNGGYFFQCKPRDPNPVVNDPAVVERFWRESETLTRAYLG